MSYRFCQEYLQNLHCHLGHTHSILIFSFQAGSGLFFRLLSFFLYVWHESGSPVARPAQEIRFRYKWWSWADSNRRPNIAPGSFLHAYSFYCFRPSSAGRQANGGLSFESWQDLKESSRASGLDDTPYSGHNRPKALRDTRRSRSLGGRRLSQTTW